MKNKMYKHIPNESPEVGTKVYPYSPLFKDAVWFVQKTNEGKSYVKILSVDQLPFIVNMNVAPAGYNPVYENWIGVTNPKCKRGFIVFLDKEPSGTEGIQIDKVFRSCAEGRLI